MVLVDGKQLESVVKKAPPGFGNDPVRHRYDVIFLKLPLRADSILPGISLKDGVDEAFERNGVLYLQRLASRASQSHFPKLTRHPAYGGMTVRNWRTTVELCRLIAPGKPAAPQIIRQRNP